MHDQDDACTLEHVIANVEGNELLLKEIMVLHKEGDQVGSDEKHEDVSGKLNNVNIECDA